MTPQARHGFAGPGGSGPAVTPKGRRAHIKKKMKTRVQARTYYFSLASMKAWEKTHPFKPFTKAQWAVWDRKHCRMKLRFAAFTKAQTAAWDKAHPFKPFTAAQWTAWDKAHPQPSSTVKAPKAGKAAKAQKPSKSLCLPLR